MVNDPIADMLKANSQRHAGASINKSSCRSRRSRWRWRILKDEGFIKDFEVTKDTRNRNCGWC